MVFPYQGKVPQVDPSCFTAPGAVIIGDVVIGAQSSVWYNAVIRGDVNAIRIGARTNIQDGTTIHADSGVALPGGGATVVGDDVTVGHNCILHACTVEDCCLIGMGAIVLDGARIGRGSIIGAGSVVLMNTVIPPYSVVVGSPGRVVKTLDLQSEQDRRSQAAHYVWLAEQNRDSIAPLDA